MQPHSIPPLRPNGTVVKLLYATLRFLLFECANSTKMNDADGLVSRNS